MNIIPPTFSFKGNKEKGINLKATALQFYKFIVNQLEVGGLSFLYRTLVMPDGSVITATVKKEAIYGAITGSISINSPYTPTVETDYSIFPTFSNTENVVYYYEDAEFKLRTSSRTKMGGAGQMERWFYGDYGNMATVGGSWHDGKEDTVTWTGTHVYYKNMELEIASGDYFYNPTYPVHLIVLYTVIHSARLIKASPEVAEAKGIPVGTPLISIIVGCYDGQATGKPWALRESYARLVILRASNLSAISFTDLEITKEPIIGKIFSVSNLDNTGSYLLYTYFNNRSTTQDVYRLNITPLLTEGTRDTVYSGTVKHVLQESSGGWTYNSSSSSSRSGGVVGTVPAVQALISEIGGIYALVNDIQSATYTGSTSTTIIELDPPPDHSYDDYITSGSNSSSIASSFEIYKWDDENSVFIPHWKPTPLISPENTYSSSGLSTGTTTYGPPLFPDEYSESHSSSSTSTYDEVNAVVISGDSKVICFYYLRYIDGISREDYSNSGFDDWYNDLRIATDTSNTHITGYRQLAEYSGTGTVLFPWRGDSAPFSTVYIPSVGFYHSPPVAITPKLLLASGGIKSEMTTPPDNNVYFTFITDLETGVVSQKTTADNLYPTGTYRYSPIGLTSAQIK